MSLEQTVKFLLLAQIGAASLDYFTYCTFVEVIGKNLLSKKFLSSFSVMFLAIDE